MHVVHGVVQHYAWGDQVALPALLGLEPDGRPWAELWFGTHAAAPSLIADGPRLADVSGDLPYLLKVLAAGDPLSLQTHPSADQARHGFAREEDAGIDAFAPERIYRDRNAKPELLCALTPFDALCGFAPVAESSALLDELGATDLAAQLRAAGLPATVAALYRGEIAPSEALAACAHAPQPEAALARELSALYPDDPSTVVTLLLRHVHLEPGEAIFLGPGNLHAYLSGVGVEVMGASDNVVRGGLTRKHVDVDELLRILDVAPIADPVVRAVEQTGGWASYDTPGTPFRLWRTDVDGSADHAATGRELLLCTAGDVGPLARGQAIYLAPGEEVRLVGSGTVFRVEET